MTRRNLLICLTLSVLLSGCKLPGEKIQNTWECGTGNPLEFLKGPEYTNPRFELVSASPLHPSEDFWLRKGEALALKWDELTYFINRAGATCDFNRPCSQDTEECHRCQSCFHGCDTAHPHWCDVSYSPANQSLDYFLKVAQFHGFVRSATPTFVTAYQPIGVCPNANPDSAPTFLPQANATLQMLHRSFAACRTPTDLDNATLLAETKVFVVGNGLQQAATYELGSYTDPQNPTVSFRKWVVEGTAKWKENYSSSLQVGRVRVFKGTPGVDPVTGIFRLEDRQFVRPSRIVLIQNFQDGQSVFAADRLRCYSDLNTEHGEIDLTECRSTFNSGSTGPIDATPTYLKGSPSGKLTWFVEFNPAEGADFDPLTPALDPVPAEAVLAIVFIIQ